MKPPVKVLLVYPEIPITFWSFKYALRFIGKKSASPPLGLITIAALLPKEWELKLIDTNVEKLRIRDLKRADYVFISAMNIQKASALHIINLCKSLNIIVIAGGPLFTTEYEKFKDVHYFVLNEGEITLPGFLNDLIAGHPKPVYRTDNFAEIDTSPAPRIDLLKLGKYASMSVQYSRGCPFNCEFCDITMLYGHQVRTKNTTQFLHELDNLYQAGWRNSVFIVDDNFIGNKKKLINEILPALTVWMKEHHYPFRFNTQASIELSDNVLLMDMMVLAGFRTVFIGIETPNKDSLLECNKNQNVKRDLLTAVHQIYRHGLHVQGGFIIGFDKDPLYIFENQIRFIQESGIVTAMVGLLNALPKTAFFQRMVREKRLLESSSGNNTDASVNFVPKMNIDTLIRGYRHTVNTIYSSRKYYERIKVFLKLYKPPELSYNRINFSEFMALLKSFLLVGIFSRMRFDFWRLFWWTLILKPRLLKITITYSIYGYHFQKILARHFT